MPLPVINKAIIAITSSIAFGGIVYGTYSQLSSANNVRETLIKQFKNPLDLSAEDGEDSEHLKELAKQYFNDKLAGKTKIDGLILNNATDIEPLKKKCEVLLNSSSKDNNFNKNLKDAENWCTKESAPRKITDLLNKKGKILLTKEDNKEWEKPWETFRNKYQKDNPESPWNFDNWENLKTKVPVETAFQDKCIANKDGSLMLTEEKLLSEIEEYCTKDKANGK